MNSFSRFVIGLISSVVLAMVVCDQWLNTWAQSMMPASQSQGIVQRPEWFHTRTKDRDGDKWGMSRVGYTDIDYEYIAPNTFNAGSKKVGYHKAVINELGGRGLLKPFDKFVDLRGVVVGDSFAFGRGVSEQETLTYFLENEIDQAEFHNFAVGGYSFWATMEVILQKALYLNPDKIFYVTYNKDNYVDGLTFIQAACDRLHIDFYIVFQPPWVLGDQVVNDYKQHVQKIAESSNVKLIDLSLVMDVVDRKKLIAQDGHPSELANRLSAKKIAEIISGFDSKVFFNERRTRAHVLLKSIERKLIRVQALREKWKKKSDIVRWLDQRESFFQQVKLMRSEELK